MNGLEEAFMAGIMLSVLTWGVIKIIWKYAILERGEQDERSRESGTRSDPREPGRISRQSDGAICNLGGLENTCQTY